MIFACSFGAFLSAASHQLQLHWGWQQFTSVLFSVIISVYQLVYQFSRLKNGRWQKQTTELVLVLMLWLQFCMTDHLSWSAKKWEKSLCVHCACTNLSAISKISKMLCAYIRWTSERHWETCLWTISMISDPGNGVHFKYPYLSHLCIHRCLCASLWTFATP